MKDKEKTKISLHYGCMADKISVQLKKQGIKLPKNDREYCDDLFESLNFLGFYMTDRQRESINKKVHKKSSKLFAKHIEGQDMSDYEDYDNLAFEPKCRTNKIVGQKNKKVSNKMIGCLCKFWDSKDDKPYGTFGILTGIDKKFTYDELKGTYPFSCLYGHHYKHCEPVKPDEVKFYEDK